MLRVTVYDGDGRRIALVPTLVRPVQHRIGPLVDATQGMTPQRAGWKAPHSCHMYRPERPITELSTEPIEPPCVQMNITSTTLFANHRG